MVKKVRLIPGQGPVLPPKARLKIKRPPPDKVTPTDIVNMILDVYDNACVAQKYSDALEATKQLGEYLDIFKSKPTAVNQILNITDTAAYTKDLEKYARAAGIQLQLEDKTVDAEFSVPSEGTQGSDGGGGDDPKPRFVDLRPGGVKARPRVLPSVDSPAGDGASGVRGDDPVDKNDSVSEPGGNPDEPPWAGASKETHPPQSPESQEIGVVESGN